MNSRDLWDECYSGDHRKESPAAFKKLFCGSCLNPGCVNSVQSQTLWTKRMLTQKDVLLENPRFASESDSRFDAIREVDFQDMVQSALALEVSAQKGDWSIPTEEEIGKAAAEMVGMAVPIKPEPEPEPEPEPPKNHPLKELNAKQAVRRLRDATTIEEIDFLLSPLEMGGTKEDRKTVLRAAEGLRLKLQPPPEPEPEQHEPESEHEQHEQPESDSDNEPTQDETQLETGFWRVRGDSGDIYDVRCFDDGSWSCSCPAFVFKRTLCKHVIDIQQRLNNAPQEQPAAPIREKAPKPPTREAPAGFMGRARNTTIPSEGLMVGGPTAPSSVDDWAAPTPVVRNPRERKIEPGGRITMGGGTHQKGGEDE